jgi:hypothetical protein
MHLSLVPHVTPISSSTITVTIFSEGYWLWSSSLYSSHQPPIISSHLGKYILSALFSNTLNLRYSPIIRTEFTPVQPAQKIIVLHILIFMFLHNTDKKTEGSKLNSKEHYPNSICSSFPRESNFYMLQLSNILTLPHFKRI